MKKLKINFFFSKSRLFETWKGVDFLNTNFTVITILVKFYVIFYRKYYKP